MTQMKGALNKGPVSVSVQADQDAFMDYEVTSQGAPVLTAESCPGTDLDHAILAVGYGVASDGKTEYLIVKNSWGTKWGD